MEEADNRVTLSRHEGEQRTEIRSQFLSTIRFLNTAS